MEQACPLCHSEAKVELLMWADANKVVHVKCPVCTQFVVPLGLFSSDLQPFVRLSRAPSWLRAEISRRIEQLFAPNAGVQGVPVLAADWVSDPVGTGLTARTVGQRQSDMLRAIGDAVAQPGESWSIRDAVPFSVGALDENDVRGLLGLLVERGLIRRDSVLGDLACHLTATGWDAYEALARGSDSNQVFVAMSFDPELNEVFDIGMEPVIRGLGLTPMILRKKAHNNRIDAEIEAEIRKSALLIADVTQNKPGVYYEAGLARGWGIPVIWTVHKDEMDNKTVHFDTRQFLHIVWTTPQDLAEQLKPHIDNTFLAERRARGR